MRCVSRKRKDSDTARITRLLSTKRSFCLENQHSDKERKPFVFLSLLWLGLYGVPAISRSSFFGREAAHGPHE